MSRLHETEANGFSADWISKVKLSSSSLSQLSSIPPLRSSPGGFCPVCRLFLSDTDPSVH